MEHFLYSPYCKESDPQLKTKKDRSNTGNSSNAGNKPIDLDSNIHLRMPQKVFNEGKEVTEQHFKSMFTQKAPQRVFAICCEKSWKPYLCGRTMETRKQIHNDFNNSNRHYIVFATASKMRKVYF
eukprot:CCRYP_008531-RE/>CCRYP_008531-RE protein AED:0.70 eAED:0.58 QI:0/0/0/1/0/0/2/0/124